MDRRDLIEMGSEVSSRLALPVLLRQAASEYGQNKAITFGGKTLDFTTVDRIGDRIAAGLNRRGIGKGDRIGLYAFNSDCFALAYCGIIKAGGTVVPINLLLNPKEVSFILRDAGVKALFFTENFRNAVDSIRGEIGSLSFCVSIGGEPASGGEPSWNDLLKEKGIPPEFEFNPPGDLAAILYTSGTTGQPKGAMLTHWNLISNTKSIREALRLEKGQETFLVVLPMFHSFAATVGMLFPLLNGCHLVPLTKFEPELVARTIEETKATIFLGVPSMYTVFLRLPEERVSCFSSLRYCVSGGSALPPEVLKKFEARFGKLIYEGDGPTECSPVTCVNPIGGRRKIGSVGLPIPDVEMKILDEAGGELPRGEVGEICVRGPNVMKGYWNRPEETRESFSGEWFRTGDLGTQDEDGYFFIVDRKKDMIIVNGMNVYPRIVEDVLYQFDRVREAAVVGQPHKLHGEIPVAYIVLEEGARGTDSEVREFCRQHLGRHEIPRRVHFVAELPRNAGGKILKRQLRKQGEIEQGVDAS